MSWYHSPDFVPAESPVLETMAEAIITAAASVTSTVSTLFGALMPSYDEEEQLTRSLSANDGESLINITGGIRAVDGKFIEKAGGACTDGDEAGGLSAESELIAAVGSPRVEDKDNGNDDEVVDGAEGVDGNDEGAAGVDIDDEGAAGVACGSPTQEERVFAGRTVPMGLTYPSDDEFEDVSDDEVFVAPSPARASRACFGTFVGDANFFAGVAGPAGAAACAAAAEASAAVDAPANTGYGDYLPADTMMEDAPECLFDDYMVKEDAREPMDVDEEEDVCPMDVDFEEDVSPMDIDDEDICPMDVDLEW